MKIARSGFLLLAVLLVFSMVQPLWAQRDQRRTRPHYHPEIVKPQIVKPEFADSRVDRPERVRPEFERSARERGRRERSRVQAPRFEKREIERPQYADNFPGLYTRPPKPEPVLEPAPMLPASERAIVRSGHASVRRPVHKPKLRSSLSREVRPARPARRHRP